MKLGINLPWGGNDHYGWDIGPQPVAVDGSKPDDAWIAARLLSPGANGSKTNLDAQFAALKKLGIQCVRMFILADGTNLNPPTIDNNGQWQIPSNSLDPMHLSDFGTVLQVCVRQNMLLMPVFVDYQLFAPPAIMIQHLGSTNMTLSSDAVFIPPGQDSVDDFVDNYYQDPVQALFRNDSRSVDWHKFVKGGRAPILRKRDQVDGFLKSTLKPLLDVSESETDFKQQILAWDIMNEPEVAINMFLNDSNWKANASDPVLGYPLAYFIQASAAMILGYDMKATVGFQTAMPLGQDDGFQSSLQVKDASGNTTYNSLGAEVTEIQKVVTTLLLPNPNFLPQCHYYPKDSAGNSGQTKLLSKSAFKLGIGSTLVLGEFATRINSSGPSPWGSDIPGTDSVVARLQAANSKGYDWAFPWSATSGIDGRSYFDPQQYKNYASAGPSGP